MKNKLMVLVGMGLALAPVLASAQSDTSSYCSGTSEATLQRIFCMIADFLNAAIPVIIVLAVLYFIWGVISYVIAGDEEAKSSARSVMIYGIIGLVVIVGVWGLVNVVLKTFGVTPSQTIQLPTVQY